MASSSASNPAEIAGWQRRLPGSGRVLVVEDEPVLRDTLSVLITMEGCETRSASDAASALALLQEWTPDLILLDFGLPGMSGEEFLAAYHQRSGTHAPVILLTGKPLSSVQAAAMGAAGILAKPFTIPDLLDVIASFADCTAD